MFIHCQVRSFDLLSQVKSLERDALTAVTVLRRQINAKSSPIYRLPPESLSMIASCLDVNGLFTAIHVSYRWRTTLFSFPNLWSNIQYGNDEMLALLQWRQWGRDFPIFPKNHTPGPIGTRT